MGTLIAYGHKPVDAETKDGAAWIPLEQLEAATGWAFKPEGVCRDTVCVPVPPAAAREFVRDGRFNVVRFAEHMGQPVVPEAGAELVVVGERADDRRSRLESLQAPDFALPDLDGKLHRLSDHRGKKVLVVTWASW